MRKILLILSAISVFCIGLLCGRLSFKVFPPNWGEPEIIHDTIKVDKPVEVEVIPDGYDLVPVGKYSDALSTIDALEDSLARKPKIIVKDSLVYVNIPMEKKEYRDENYFAIVSGYKPTLEYIETYNTTKTIRKRWGVGVTAGVGVTKDGLSPSVTIGATYLLF